MKNRNINCSERWRHQSSRTMTLYYYVQYCSAQIEIVARREVGLQTAVGLRYYESYKTISSILLA